MIISRSFLLRMRNVSDKSCRENQNTHFMFKVFFPKILLFMRKRGIMLYSRTGHMRISRWIPKATGTHSEYVVPIAFPRQRWLRERALILSCTYIACLVLPQPNAALLMWDRLYLQSGGIYLLSDVFSLISLVALLHAANTNSSAIYSQW
jgi:hypothetical protein